MAAPWRKRADAFLARHVDTDGRFHYERADAPENLDAILADVARQDPGGFESKDEELAFFLNAYNLAALAIAARWYRRSRRVQRHGLGGWWARFRFFLLERVTVARRRRTLFGLEFFTIHRRFKDPRIHFALVCATGSCPPLRDGLFSGSRLDQELDQAARAFLRPDMGYQLDHDRNRITFNRIFRWYAKEFETIGGPLGALERWGPKQAMEYVRRHGPRVRFAKYDWHLNQAGELTIHTEPRPAAPPRREHNREGDQA